MAPAAQGVAKGLILVEKSQAPANGGFSAAVSLLSCGRGKLAAIVS